MNLSRLILVKAGCSAWLHKFADPDVAALWAAWSSAPELVQLLTSLGRDVRPVLRSIAAPSPTLSAIVERELAPQHPTASPWNACCELAHYLGDAPVVDALKAAFPLSTLVDDMIEMVS